jgi:hypothetical protein
MRAVWSFWSKPVREEKALGWRSELYHLLSWVLSTQTARQHFPQTALHTDDEGAELLVGALGLDFDLVCTDLNILDDYDPEWWAIGKVYTYLLQTEPFVHIDSDVFLWKPLPRRMEQAPLLGQNPEYFDAGGSWYYLQKFDLLRQLDGWIPEEVEWYMTTFSRQRAICCGIFGGNRLDFIQYYAKRAIDLLTHPCNQPVWTLLGGDNILIEQYTLSACLEYHRAAESSPYSDIFIDCLFGSSDEAFKSANAARCGYTHLIGGAKRSAFACDRLAERVARDYPAYYERCMRYGSR